MNQNDASDPTAYEVTLVKISGLTRKVDFFNKYVIANTTTIIAI
jgi:hypothetical protein